MLYHGNVSSDSRSHKKALQNIPDWEEVFLKNPRFYLLPRESANFEADRTFVLGAVSMRNNQDLIGHSGETAQVLQKANETGNISRNIRSSRISDPRGACLAISPCNKTRQTFWMMQAVVHAGDDQTLLIALLS